MFPISKSRGFGLIEIMVGLVIGMLASVIIFQVFEVSERQKRTTTSSADAQTNGALGLYMLERDAKMAGFGLESDVIAKCNTGQLFNYFDGAPIEGLDSPAALTITAGTNAGDPDQITIVYYSDPSNAGLGFPSTTQLDKSMPTASSVLKVKNPDGCYPGELAIVQQAGNCTLLGITDVKNQSGEQQVLHTTAASDAVAAYNPPTPYENAHNWPGYGVGATLRCGLSTPVVRTYRLDANSLVIEDVGEKPQTATITPHIVTLQAEYGIAAAGAQELESWVSPTESWAKETLSKNDGKRIKAVRVAVVARSAEYEKPQPGQACSTTTEEMVGSWSTWADLTGVKALPDWQCYRYKAFETVIPLRNVIWANLE